MKILLAESNNNVRQKFEALLVKWGFDVISCTNGLQALEILQSNPAPRLALIGWRTQNIDHIKQLEFTQKQQNKEYAFMILVTGKENVEDTRQIMSNIEFGVDDYIYDYSDPGDIFLRLQTAMRIIDLEDTIIKLREDTKVHNTYDSLTGLLNRSAVLDSLQRELARAKREKSSISVIILDVDNFNLINEKHGDAVGDQVLAEIGKRIKAAVRRYDIIGRLSGEEFIAVLPGCNTPFVMDQAERIRDHISKSPIDTIDGKVQVTASLGVAARSESIQIGAHSLIGVAYHALKQAKSTGKNKVHLAL